MISRTSLASKSMSFIRASMASIELISGSGLCLQIRLYVSETQGVRVCCLFNGIGNPQDEPGPTSAIVDSTGMAQVKRSTCKYDLAREEQVANVRGSSCLSHHIDGMA